MPEYQEFGTFAAARKAFSRCRKRQAFILSEAAERRLNPVCAHCGKRLFDHERKPGYDSNRCEYDPGTGKIAVMDYVCAWKALFADLFRLADRLY